MRVFRRLGGGWVGILCREDASWDVKTLEKRTKKKKEVNFEICDQRASRVDYNLSTEI